MAAFLLCQSQWRYGADGLQTGLDYAGCAAIVGAAGMDFAAVAEGLRVMEFEVLRVCAERAAANAPKQQGGF